MLIAGKVGWGWEEARGNSLYLPLRCLSVNPVCPKPKSRAQFTVAIEEEMRRTWRRLKGGGMAMPSERDREAWVTPRMLEKSIGNYAIS